MAIKFRQGKTELKLKQALRHKCPYLKFFWSAFPTFEAQTIYEDLQSKSPYSDRMRENRDQKNPNMDTFHVV